MSDKDTLIPPHFDRTRLRVTRILPDDPILRIFPDLKYEIWLDDKTVMDTDELPTEEKLRKYWPHFCETEGLESLFPFPSSEEVLELPEK